MKAIFKKELRALLFSLPGALYVIINLFCLGLFTYIYNFFSQSTRVEYVISLMTLSVALTLPLIVSSIFSRDRGDGTEELVRVLPISAYDFVCGKWLAILAMNLPTVIVCAILPLIFAIFSKVNFATAYLSVAGLILFIGAVSAIFLFIASLTKKSYLAAAISYILTVVFFLLGIIPASAESGFLTFITKAIKWGALFEKFDHFVFGYLDIGTIIFFMSVAAFFFILTRLVIKKRLGEDRIKPPKLHRATVAILVAALLVAINTAYTILPSYNTQLDLTSNKKFSISGEAKKFLWGLDTDVEVVVLGTKGTNTQADHILGLMDEYSKRLTVSYGTSVEYTEDLVALGWDKTTTIPSYSLLVKSDKRSTLIDSSRFIYYYNPNFGPMSTSDYNSYYSMLYQYAMSDSSGTYYGYLMSLINETVTYYELEALTLSSIEYVSQNVIPRPYFVSGLGNSEELTVLNGTLTGSGYGLFDITSGETFPDDASSILIAKPERDLTDAELSMIREFLDNAGGMMLISDPTISEFENFSSLTSYYGVSTTAKFIAVDPSAADGEGEGEQNKFLINPVINESHDSLYQLAGETFDLLFATDISVAGTLPDSVIVTKLLTTSPEAYFNDAPDSKGEKTVGVAIEKETEAGTTEMIWLTGADAFTDEFLSPANFYIAVYAMNWCHDSYDTEIGTIAPVLLTEDALIVPSATGIIISAIIALVIPVAVGTSIAITVKKRKARKSEIIEE